MIEWWSENKTGKLDIVTISYICPIPDPLSSLQHKAYQIPTLNRPPNRPAAAPAESPEARRQVENEDVVGAAPTGDAPTTSE